MTGPDAILAWIALGCIACFALLGLMWSVALQVIAQSRDDALNDVSDEGADWGSEGAFHNPAFTSDTE